MKTNRCLIRIVVFSMIAIMLFSCSAFADPDPSEHTINVSPGTLTSTNHWNVIIDDANPVIYFNADADISSFSSQNSRWTLTKVDSQSFQGDLGGHGSGGTKVVVNFADGTSQTVTLDFTDNRSAKDSSGGNGTASGHNITIDNGTRASGKPWEITIDDNNPLIYFTSDYDVESFSSQNSRLLLSKIDGTHFKGELQGSQNAGCGIDVTFSDGTTSYFGLNITNKRTNTLSSTEKAEMEAAAPSGPVQPAKYATLRSDGSLSCSSDNEWILKVHSIAKQPLFIDTTKPIKSVDMNGAPKFKYEIVSSQCLMVYSQDKSIGRSFKVNYTDGTSDEILLRIDTDVVLDDDMAVFQDSIEGEMGTSLEEPEEIVILEEPKEIEISQTSLSELKSLEIDVNEEIHISFDPKAAEIVSALNEEQPVNLVVSQKKTEEMNQAQIAILEDKDVKTIVSVELNTSESSIHGFDGGIATVSIPFIVPEGDNPEFYRVYYVSPEGNLRLVNSSYADGEISFSTFHFSDYVVIRSEEPLAELEPAPEVQVEQTTGSIPSFCIYMAIGVVAMLGACLAYKKIRK